MTNIQHTNLFRYIFIFHIAYSAIIIALELVSNFSGTTNMNIVKFIAPMFAGIFVNESFLKRNTRLYTTSEKEKIVWGSLLSVILIEIIISGIAIFSDAFSDAVISARALIYVKIASLLFILVLNYGLLMWVYGSVAEKRLKQVEKKAQ